MKRGICAETGVGLGPLWLVRIASSPGRGGNHANRGAQAKWGSGRRRLRKRTRENARVTDSESDGNHIAGLWPVSFDAHSADPSPIRTLLDVKAIFPHL